MRKACCESGGFTPEPRVRGNVPPASAIAFASVFRTVNDSRAGPETISRFMAAELTIASDAPARAGEHGPTAVGLVWAGEEPGERPRL